METIEIIVGKGMRARLNRIKELRRKSDGMILADQEIIQAAIAAYWILRENEDASRNRQAALQRNGIG